MKILLLGARGMLGRDLLSLLSASHESCGKDVQDFDITDRKRVGEEIGACGPDAVINAAAYTDVDGCETQRDRAFAVNAEGALNVALGCARAGSRMIHLSTDYVFDGNSVLPYREDAPPNPLSVYGQSKLRGEKYVEEALENHLIVRTAWLYGRHGRNFVDTILRLASEKEELRVVHDQKGSPTFTRDLSGAIFRLLGNPFRGIVNVTSSGSCTWFDFARKILEAKPQAGRSVRVIPISSAELGRPAKRPGNSVLALSRYEQLTGVRMRNWEEGLAEYLEEGVRSS
jgi:dTDP-4-dehydrorhamnose reductase